MEWRTVPSFPKYDVSRCGRIRRNCDGPNTSAGRELHPKKNSWTGNVPKVVLKPQGCAKPQYFKVEDLVEEAFGDTPERPFGAADKVWGWRTCFRYPEYEVSELKEVRRIGTKKALPTDAWGRVHLWDGEQRVPESVTQLWSDVWAFGERDPGDFYTWSTIPGFPHYEITHRGLVRRKATQDRMAAVPTIYKSGTPAAYVQIARGTWTGRKVEKVLVTKLLQLTFGSVPRPPKKEKEVTSLLVPDKAATAPDYSVPHGTKVRIKVDPAVQKEVEVIVSADRIEIFVSKQ